MDPLTAYRRRWGTVLGPRLGGWLLQYFWWGSIFLVNVPVVAAGMLAGRWLVPESRDPAAPRIDVVGAVVSIIGLITLVWSIIEAPSRGWTSGAVPSGFALAALMLVPFAVWESRIAEPMLNLAYFRNPRFSAALISVTLLFFPLFGTVFFLSQYLQFVLGYTALEAGERTLPIATMVLGVAVLGSILSSVYEGRLGGTFAGRPVPEPAQEGIGGALAVASRLPGTRRRPSQGPREAFVYGMNRTVLVAAVVVVIGALVALIWLPVRGREATELTVGTDSDLAVELDTAADPGLADAMEAGDVREPDSAAA